MPSKVLIGLQWGDEGKGKVIDVLSKDVDAVIRFQGGANAGHTIEIGNERFVLHLIPSGITRPDCLCILGNGMVIDPFALYQEIVELENRGFSVRNRLYISDQAHMVLPYHAQIDGLSESKAGNRKIGTTKRGIGPAYTDKFNRKGIRWGDCYHFERFKDQIFQQIEEYNTIFAHEKMETLNPKTIWDKLQPLMTELLPMITNTCYQVNTLYEENKNLLLEGAQGFWLDIDFGTYPYVTSSSTGSGGASIGSGLPPNRIDEIWAVVKTYTTRVGEGPFPTELKDEVGELLRSRGREYGATTGRPRRCGWFDAVASRYAVKVAGVQHAAFTKLDVLDPLDKIGICTGYLLHGKRLSIPPTNVVDFGAVSPEIEWFPGWKESTTHVTQWSELPLQARRYLERLSELIECPISIVSVGPKRTQTFIP